MKYKILKHVSLLLTFVLFTAALAGCSQTLPSGSEATDLSSLPANSVSSQEDTGGSSGAEPDDAEPAATELTVRFGDEGEPFVMHLYNNETAAAIARHVGTADWRLPIYHYEDYDNWEVMQYYDIPSRYEIPSNPESVTEAAAGAVYYSEPNRIVLFYGNAELSGEYTPVGYFDNTETFRSAVANNPVVEGWNNKIIQISDGD